MFPVSCLRVRPLNPTSILRVSQLRSRTRPHRTWSSVNTQVGNRDDTIHEFSVISSQLVKRGPPRRHRSSINTTFHGRTSITQPRLYSQNVTTFKTPSTSDYIPPQNGFISMLPSSWVPYAELIRLDKPAGTYYLFFPCLFSTLLAAQMTTPIVSSQEIVTTSALFFAGALVMRGAGCTVNDLWDRNLDPYVERTKHRPIARGAISPPKAIAFLGFQLLTGLGILLQFPTACLYYGIPSLLLVGLYPLAKRVTNYPQFVLGLTFSWGAIMGFPALGIDLLNDTNALCAAAALYASCVAWTVNYDMIYAHMDIKDDVKVGIKSIALAHEHNTKAVLIGLSVAQIGLLTAAGIFAEAGFAFYLNGCASGGLMLALIIKRVQLKSVESCLYWFKNGAWLVGGMISSGLLLDYLLKRYGLREETWENSARGPAVDISSSP